jgi:THO complex subunit 4
LLQELFGRIGPVRTVSLIYDRQDRSTGVAYVVYPDAHDAHAAIDEFNGANANGQPIALTLVPSNPNAYTSARGGGGGAGPRSLFERVDAVERRRRTAAAATDEDDEYDDEYGNAVPRRSSVRDSRPANIDRYVPGMLDSDADEAPARGAEPLARGGGGRGRRGPAGGGGGRDTNGAGAGGRRAGGGGHSPRRENGGGRRPGQRRGGGGGQRDEQRDPDGHPIVQGRPRKTAEELDAEMADYWGAGGAAAGAGKAAAMGDDDIDMDI